MDTGNSTSIFYITQNGLSLAQRLKGLYPAADVKKFNAGIIAEAWRKGKNLIFIMATGLVVRTIAPLLRDKKTDPAVTVLDEKGSFVISLLSGHLGGANDLTRGIAAYIGGKAVITTSSDLNNMPSIDLWARENNLVIEEWERLPRIATRLLDKGKLRVYSEAGIELPKEFLKVTEPGSAELLITNRNKIDMDNNIGSRLYLRPRNIVLGIGCNSGTSGKEIGEAVRETLGENNLSFSSIHSIATIDIKGKEPGLIEFSKKYGLRIVTFKPDELNRVQGVTRSESVFKATGAHAVSEPAALLASGADKLLIQKRKRGNVTVAAAIRKEEKAKGRIFVVGTGPGGIEYITPYAQKAIRESEVIVGYGTYLDLIQELIEGKEIHSTGMTRETERCKKAIEVAKKGRTVSVISGGDPGIYAMAGLVFELLKAANDNIPVEVIPGIAALNACASRLGAPLMHDFASISLSDRLTPWALIEKRLDAAATADFVIILYNPKSMGRRNQINRARDIILRHRGPETPVGIVRAAMREDERVVMTDLENMLTHEIDMQTTVIIGNSQTFRWNDRIITPRGYSVHPDD